MSLSSFRKAGNVPTLASAFLYFDVSFMVWVILGPLGPFIGEAYKLTATQRAFLPLCRCLAARSSVRFWAGARSVLADGARDWWAWRSRSCR